MSKRKDTDYDPDSESSKKTKKQFLDQSKSFCNQNSAKILKLTREGNGPTQTAKILNTGIGLGPGKEA